MPRFTIGPVTADTDNQTASFATPGGGSVVVDGGQGTVSVTDGNGNTTTLGGFGTAPAMQLPFTGHHIRGRVLYCPAPGGILNGVSRAVVTITPVGRPAGAVTLTADEAGFYRGAFNNTFTDQLFVASVTDSTGANSISNVPLPYNQFAGEFFPIVVPFDWLFSASAVGTFRRDNLVNFDDSVAASLADFIVKRFLPVAFDGKVVDIHMAQIDHITALFSDHKTYVWQLEKALLRAGLPQFVPLPVWEPIDDIPSGFTQVHVTPGMRDAGELFQHINPLYNTIAPGFRPQIPDAIRPANLATSNFPTAHDLALYVGRSAASAFGSFHFNAHALPGGPFFDMMFAAGATLFWPVHALIVDLYDSWLKTIFTGVNRANGVAVRIAGGRRYHTLFAVTERGELWQSYQRDVVLERNDFTLLSAQTAVRAIFDPERVISRNEPEWPHWSHWEHVDVDCVIEDCRIVTDLDGRWVMLAKDEDDRLCLIWVDACGKVHCTHLNTPPVLAFAIAVAKDGTLQIVYSERNGPLLQLGSETRAGSREFTWKAKELALGLTIAGIGVIGRLAAIRGLDNLVHVFASTGTGRASGRSRPAPAGSSGGGDGHSHEHGGHSHASSQPEKPPASSARIIDIRMPVPGTVFHGVRANTGEWAFDESPFADRKFVDWCAVNCHDDCIQVFGVDQDGDLYTADLPITPDRPARTSRPGAGSAHGGHAHDHATTMTRATTGTMATPTNLADRLSGVLKKSPVSPSWTQLSVRSIRRVAACNNEDGRVELFAIDSAGKVLHSSEDANWGNWKDIPLLGIMGNETLGIFAELDYTGCIKAYVHTGKENYLYVAEQEAPNSAAFIGWLNI